MYPHLVISPLTFFFFSFFRYLVVRILYSINFLLNFLCILVGFREGLYRDWVVEINTLAPIEIN